MPAENRELTVSLPSELAKRLEDEAKENNLSLSDLVQDALELYFEDEIEDSPDEEIVESIRTGFKDAFENRVSPAREALARIRQELEDTPDEQIIEELREALQNVRDGNVHPADDVLAEIRSQVSN